MVMRFTFEEDEVADVRYSDFGFTSAVVSLHISERNRFLLSKAGYFSAELKTFYGAFFGDFVFSSIDDDFFNIESVGEITFVINESVNED
jgi:hypothetical protein